MVFIPTYRCQKQIARVLRQFDLKVQSWVDTIIIVDNLSPDQTVQDAIELGSSIISHSKFVVSRNNNNYGLGGSHKVAFDYAIKNNFDYVVVLHGDDQASIRDLIPYLESGAYETVDSLLGARFMEGSKLEGYSSFRTLGNKIFNYIFSMVLFRKIYDLGSGLNLYRVSSLDFSKLKSFPDDLTFNYAFIIAGYHKKQRIRFFPISWREEDQTSNVRLFRQSIKVISILASYCIDREKFIHSEMREKLFDAYESKILFTLPSKSQE